MRIIITVALLLVSLFANAQRIIPIGGVRTTDTGLISGSFKVDSVLILPAYRTANENIVLGFDSRGKAVLRINNDSLIYATRRYVDSGFNAITAGSVDSSIYSTVNRLYKITDSTFNIIDSNNAIIYSNIATLQGDVVTIDSAVGVAFGAISALYDTLPNYVDTAQLNDSLHAIKAAYVPYIGATTDVNLGTHNILPNSVRLSTTPTGTLTNVGQMYWDATNVTPSVPLNANVTLQMGQEMYIRARNNTGAQINDGQVVYVNDAQGNTPTIALANSDSVSSSIVIGVATENIADNSTGFVTTFGVVNGFNTSGFNDGDALYLNTVSGQLSNTIPPPPHNVVRIGVALNSTVNGKIFVKPSQALGQDTTFATPYNSNKVAPTQRAIGTYVRNIVKDTASDLRADINTKGTVNSVATGYGLAGGTITNTGTISADSTELATKALVKKQIDSVAALSGGGGGGSPTTATNPQILYKSGSDTLKGANIIIDSTDRQLVFPHSIDTTAVASYWGGGTKVVGTNRMGMGAIRIVDSVSIPAALQRAINAQNTSTIVPYSTLPQTTNAYTYYTAVGNYASTSAITNNFASYSSTIQRLGYNYAILITTASSNLNAGLFSSTLASAYGLICGNTKFSGGGGRGTFTFCLPTYLGTQRIFVGYSTAVSAQAGADPSLILNGSNQPAAILAVGKDAADSTLQFIHSVGGVGAVATKVNTGIKPNNENVYRVTVYVAPNSTFYIQLEILSKTGTQTLVLNPTTNVPPVETKLVSRQLIGNGLSGGVIHFGFINHMEEIY